MAMRYSQLDKKFTDEPPSMLDPTGREALRNVANSGGELGREIQNQKHADDRLKRIANKAYRTATKSNDPVAMMKAYEFLQGINKIGGSIGGGIQQAGQSTYKATQDALYARDQMTGQDSQIPGMGAGSLNPNGQGQSSQPSPSGGRLDSSSNTNFVDQAQDSSLIRTGQGAFGPQGKIDKANSLLDKYTNDENYTDEMLRKDAELMGADPDIAQDQAHKKLASVLDEQEKQAALAQSRTQADDLVTKFSKGDVNYDDAIKQGLELGGKEESIKSRLDPIVQRQEQQKKAEEADVAEAKKRTDERNREILGKDRTPYEKFDPSVGLEERQAKAQVEFDARKKKTDSLIKSANDVAQQSTDRQNALADQRVATEEQNATRRKGMEKEFSLMSEESKKIRSAYTKAGQLGYSTLDMVNPFSSTIDAPFAPHSATKISFLFDDIRTEIDNRSNKVGDRDDAIKDLYVEVANADKAFNKALGGKETKRDGVTYQTDAYDSHKKQVLSGGKYSSVFNQRLIKSAIDTGYPIELDKDLMANEGFKKALNDYKEQEGIKEPMTTYFPKYKKGRKVEKKAEAEPTPAYF